MHAGPVLIPSIAMIRFPRIFRAAFFQSGSCRGLFLRGTAACATVAMSAWSGASAQTAEDSGLAVAHAEHLRETKGILDIRTIHPSKLGSKGMDLVIVSAGFTAAEREKFLGHAEDMKETFFSYAPWNRYRDWVSFHTVFVDDVGPADTKLKVAGYEGQILICDNGIASEYGMHAADADAVLVLHNSNFSTPACGMWGVTVYNIRDTKNSGSTVHELGHGLAGLGDEYIQRSDPFDGPPESLRDTVNVTAEPNPRLCKWHYWTVPEWPGPLGPLSYRGAMPVRNFEGAGWPKGIYRPEESCMMRGDRNAFCAVCDETMQANIFRYVELFDRVEPPDGDIVLWDGEALDFRVAAIAPLRDPQPWLQSRLDLYVAGRKVAGSDCGVASHRINSGTLKPGVHPLGAVLNVQCEAVRRDFGFLSDHRAWRLTVIPHAKPVLKVPPQLVAAPRDAVNIPVAIRHRNPGLFPLRMEHAPDQAVLEGGRFRWRPDGRTGSWRVDFIVSYEGRDVLTESMRIHVDQAGGGSGRVEIKAMEPVAAVAGSPLSVKLSDAVSAAGGNLLFESGALPHGVVLDHASGELSWTPARHQAGPHRIPFTVRSGRAAGEGSVVLHVARPGRPTPVSYSNSYTPDTLANLTQWQESPLLYQRIFGTLRLLRDRYARIYEPALAEAEKMFAELSPSYRANMIGQLSMHAWAFTDKPQVLAWLRRIAAEGDTADHQELLRQLDLMATLEKIKKVEVESDRQDLIPAAQALVKEPDPAVQSAIEMAVTAIRERADDDDACRNDLLSVLKQSWGPGRAALVPLVPVRRTPELVEAMAALAKDKDPEVAAAARRTLDYLDGLGAKNDFITRWRVAGPYPGGEGVSLFEEPFGPEKPGEKVEWRTLELEASANGVHAADLGALFGGENRAAYLKTTLRSTSDQEVMFAAGSDDAIKVWLNGELIHAKNAQRGVTPGEDKFRARLRKGDNVVLCKIVQYVLGWGACMSVHAPDGGPALGVSVIGGAD
jgi:hypothetical protein